MKLSTKEMSIFALKIPEAKRDNHDLNIRWGLDCHAVNLYSEPITTNISKST